MKVIKLTESDLIRITKKILKEQMTKDEIEKLKKERENISQTFKKVKDSLSNFLSPKVMTGLISWSDDKNWFLRISESGDLTLGTSPKWGYVPPFGLFDYKFKPNPKKEYTVNFIELNSDEFIKDIKNLLTDIKSYIPKTKDSVTPSTEPKHHKRINDPNNYFPIPKVEKPYQNPYSVHSVKPVT
jgi:hypothetical protein